MVIKLEKCYFVEITVVNNYKNVAIDPKCKIIDVTLHESYWLDAQTILECHK